MDPGMTVFDTADIFCWIKSKCEIVFKGVLTGKFAGPKGSLAARQTFDIFCWIESKCEIVFKGVLTGKFAGRKGSLASRQTFHQ